MYEAKSSKYEKKGNIDKAMYELQKAVKSSGKEEEVKELQQKLQELVVRSAASNDRSVTFSNLLKEIESEDPMTSKEAVAKLLAYSSEKGFCSQAGKEAVTGIFEAVSNLSKPSSSDSVEIVASLYKVLANFALVVPLEMEKYLLANLDMDLYSPSKVSAKSVPLLSAVVELLIHLTGKGADAKNEGPSDTLVDLLYQYLNIMGLESDHELLGMKKLPSLFVNQRFASSFLCDERREFLLRMAAANVNSRGMLIQSLTIVFGHYSESDGDFPMLKSLRDFLCQKVASSGNNDAVWLLFCLCEASPKHMLFFFSDSNLLENVVDLLETTKDMLPLISLLSLAFGSPELRKMLTPDSLNVLTSVNLDILSTSVQIPFILALIKCSPSKYLGNERILSLVLDIICGQEVGFEQEHTIILQSLEALSYLSSVGSVKEVIVAKIATITQSFIMMRKKFGRNAAVDFAIVTIIYNVSIYPQSLSQEEEQVQKLHEMANSVPKKDPLNSRECVAVRVKKLVENSKAILLLEVITSTSTNTKKMLCSIYLSIATEQRFRGLLIQAGSCKKLIALANSLQKDGFDAAQALAKIAITSNPALAFKGELVIEAVRPLVYLLCNSDSLLCQFESLMALTNFAGYAEPAREKIIQMNALDNILECQFSSNKMIRRAATEALCNLVFHETVFQLVIAENSQLLAIMVALCDDDDFPTSRAASGFLAVVSSETAVVPKLLKQKRCQDILKKLLEGDDKIELQHRAIETVKNIVSAGESGKISVLLQAARRLRTSKASPVSDIAKML